jgi:hypothetical protein
MSHETRPLLKRILHVCSVALGLLVIGAAGVAHADQGDTITSLSVNPNPALEGTTVYIGCSVSAEAAAPSGGVTLLDGDAVLAEVGFDPGGSCSVYCDPYTGICLSVCSHHASWNTASLAPGEHTISCTYGGGDTTVPSASEPVVLVIQPLASVPDLQVVGIVVLVTVLGGCGVVQLLRVR